MSATLSILGLYNYDNSIFDNMLIPTGIDREDVTNNLLIELAEFELLYPNFDTMKAVIGFWSKKEFPVWEKLLSTTKFEYNPIWNFDRTEEYTDTETRNLSGSNNETRNLAGSDLETRNLAGSDLETRNLAGSDLETRNTTDKIVKHSETEGITTNNGTDTNKEYVSGFNETTPSLSKQNEQIMGSGNTVKGSVDGTDTTTGTGTVKNDTTDTGTVNKALTDTGTVNKALTDTGTVNKALTDTGTVENKHTARLTGNIGVTTTQQMIEAERNLVKFNVVNYIIDSFKTRFCILVY